ncbi:ATP-binding cassette domain-containing protein [Occultella glacieicola]|uniref:ATP-binding cassette domain-containing protein n=1 Tax=Occultella glacieicola TaxID=2518684 RepID=A0ABY2DZ62_9MICO|nr:ATP-binding cassette domain-containing protein [Occultella glacieicola]TDE89976.1 ATP-binding cassette domain-containing protein [Occultella glacieicola]
MSDLISVTDLRVDLGSATILRGINLTVGEGEVVALLGANGSGKSTLMRSLLGLVPITGGDARLFGTSVRTQRRQIPWPRIGYVPQRAAVGSGIPATALEVVLTGLLNDRRWHVPRGGRARGLAALESVDLGDRANSPLHQLSGGQQQRVAIARALVRRPDLLLLDEPMAGVDRPTQQTFARLLATLQSEGITVGIVLHELGPIRPLIQRCVVLRHGQVAHDGGIPAPAPGHGDADHEHVHLDHGHHERADVHEAVTPRSLP